MQKLNNENRERIKEILKKDLEMKGQLSAFDNTLASIEFDMKGHILRANELFLNLMGFQEEEVIGKQHELFAVNIKD